MQSWPKLLCCVPRYERTCCVRMFKLAALPVYCIVAGATGELLQKWLSRVAHSSFWWFELEKKIPSVKTVTYITHSRMDHHNQTADAASFASNPNSGASISTFSTLPSNYVATVPTSHNHSHPQPISPKKPANFKIPNPQPNQRPTNIEFKYKHAIQKPTKPINKLIPSNFRAPIVNDSLLASQVLVLSLSAVNDGCESDSDSDADPLYLSDSDYNNGAEEMAAFEAAEKKSSAPPPPSTSASTSTPVPKLKFDFKHANPSPRQRLYKLQQSKTARIESPETCDFDDEINTSRSEPNHIMSSSATNNDRILSLANKLNLNLSLDVVSDGSGSEAVNVQRSAAVANSNKIMSAPPQHNVVKMNQPQITDVIDFSTTRQEIDAIPITQHNPTAPFSPIKKTEVSERSERALRMTIILAIDE